MLLLAELFHLNRHGMLLYSFKAKAAFRVTAVTTNRRLHERQRPFRHR